MNNRQIAAAALLLLGVTGALALREFGVFTSSDAPKYRVKYRAKSPEFRLPADNQPLLIAVLGTSLSAANDWPPALEARLKACRTGPTRIAVNAKAGASSAWGLSVVDKVFAGKPNLILMELAANDASLLKGMRLSQSRATHEAILARASKARIPVILMTMNPAYGAKRAARPGQASYRAMYHSLALDNRTGLIDTWPHWEALSGSERKKAIPDGIHPQKDAAIKAMVEPILSVISAKECAKRTILEHRKP